MGLEWIEMLEMTEGMMESFSGVSTVISPLAYVGGFAAYILLGIAVMLMGQKLGLKNPWLSWIPYAKNYAFGRIADQYRSEDPLKKDKEGKSAKLLLILSIVQTVVVIPVVVLAVLVIVLAMTEAGSTGVIVGLTIAMVLMLLVLFAVFVIYNVFYYIAFYRITRLYMGKQYQIWFVLGLVLSLVGIGIAVPVVMIVLAGKEPFAKAQEPLFYSQPAEPAKEEDCSDKAE